tara:strand:- start:1156 stop:1302 length:147 start_codon:yes stop_codon:yes gene_type:complete
VRESTNSYLTLANHVVACTVEEWEEYAEDFLPDWELIQCTNVNIDITD